MNDKEAASALGMLMDNEEAFKYYLKWDLLIERKLAQISVKEFYKNFYSEESTFNLD